MGKLWQTQPGSALAADLFPYRLIVDRVPGGGSAIRFRVFQRRSGQLDLISAGICGSALDAMAAAEAIQERLAEIHLGSSVPHPFGRVREPATAVLRL